MVEISLLESVTWYWVGNGGWKGKILTAVVVEIANGNYIGFCVRVVRYQ